LTFPHRHSYPAHGSAPLGAALWKLCASFRSGCCQFWSLSDGVRCEWTDGSDGSCLQGVLELLPDRCRSPHCLLGFCASSCSLSMAIWCFYLPAVDGNLVVVAALSCGRKVELSSSSSSDSMAKCRLLLRAVEFCDGCASGIGIHHRGERRHASAERRHSASERRHSAKRFSFLSFSPSAACCSAAHICSAAARWAIANSLPRFGAPDRAMLNVDVDDLATNPFGKYSGLACKLTFLWGNWSVSAAS